MFAATGLVRVRKPLKQRPRLSRARYWRKGLSNLSATWHLNESHSRSEKRLLVALCGLRLTHTGVENFFKVAACNR